MNRHVTWKLLVLGSLMIAALCSPSAIAAEQSQKQGSQNFTFAKFRSSGDEDIDTQRYQKLWFWKQPAPKPATKLSSIGHETFNTNASDDFETDGLTISNTRRFEKIIALGRSMYLKPGFGIEPEKTIENFGLEVGFRYFF